ncbi:hypothetical protein ABZ135_01435 [Streptomyces sp. NPDC006339]|uniref:hypothetical protein n=1 Tax=Streptomyces sp. NPDC006339 TaxID=3156755 RepID=UPI0033ABF693
MSNHTWTIDSITHALPHPELRATFQREVAFTEVAKLHTILDRWVQFVTDIEAGRAEVELVREHIREHGQLPSGYDQETRDSISRYEELKARIEAQRRGHNAA